MDFFCNAVAIYLLSIGFFLSFYKRGMPILAAVSTLSFTAFSIEVLTGLRHDPAIASLVKPLFSKAGLDVFRKALDPADRCFDQL